MVIDDNMIERLQEMKEFLDQEFINMLFKSNLVEREIIMKKYYDFKTEQLEIENELYKILK